MKSDALALMEAASFCAGFQHKRLPHRNIIDYLCSVPSLCSGEQTAGPELLKGRIGEAISY